MLLAEAAREVREALEADRHRLWRDRGDLLGVYFSAPVRWPWRRLSLSVRAVKSTTGM